MKNKIIAFLVFVASILPVSYSMASDESETEHDSESDSRAEDVSGPGDVDQDIYRAEQFFKKGKFGHVIKVLSFDTDHENLPLAESARAYNLIKNANKNVYGKNIPDATLALIAQSYFRGDYKLTKKYFDDMPGHVRKDLPSIYVLMENMLEPSAHDYFNPEDFEPKFNQFFSLLEKGDLHAAASMAIRLKKSYDKAWPISFQQCALYAVKQHAQNEINKSRFMATHSRSAKENAAPITMKKHEKRNFPNTPFKGKLHDALVNATNTSNKQ